MNFVRFISQGTGEAYRRSGEDRPLNATELRPVLTRVIECSRRSNISTNTNLPLYHLLGEEFGAHGQMGFQGVIVDYRGRLKVSSRTDFVLGDIREKGLENLFLRHPVMAALRSGKIEECGSCVYYTRCGGDRNSAFAETGSFLKKDPGCWL
jgi:radical SAM protein with 4Fe4S-binding SPASM domain